ncbi:MAG TPA: hypothetical protein VHT51_21125, partial [Micropepsaceae bacterium]|nr:hypothetical protein [Micropepsaceae bacterium]
MRTVHLQLQDTLEGLARFWREQVSAAFDAETLPSPVSVRQTNDPGRALHHYVLGIGVISLLLGLAMAGARIKNPIWLDALLPSLFYTKFNTALAFVMAGAGLSAAGLKSQRVAAFAGAILLAIGGITLLEYLTDLNLGLDEALVRDFREPLGPHPGRMAPNTALAFACIGFSILRLKHCARSARYIAVCELLAFLVFALGTAGLLGHVAGVERAYGWGNST